MNCEELNYDFNYNLFIAKTLLPNLSACDKKFAAKWIQKLLSSDTSITEMKYRNDFMYYLVLDIQKQKLDTPFNREPPVNTVMEYVYFLPQDDTPCSSAENQPEMNEGRKKSSSSRSRSESASKTRSSPGSPQTGGTNQSSFIYNNSPDGGAFLAAQPVPRCGAFCYLAVVTRSNKNKCT